MSSDNPGNAFDTPNADSPQSPRRGLIGWIVRHPKSTAAGALMLLLIGSCKLLDMKAEQQFQRELDAIRASGAPVTLDDLNALKCDVPDEENIALLIEAPAEAMTAYKLPEDRREITPVVGNGRLPPCGERMSADALAATEAYLTDIAPHLAQAHEALRHERGCRVPHWTSPAFLDQLSQYSEMRITAKAIRLGAWSAANAGDQAIACQRVCDLAALDRAFHGRDDCISSLVRMATHALARDAAADAVNLGGLDDSQLVLVQTALREPDWLPVMRRMMEVERALLLDTVHWHFAANMPVGDMQPLPFFLRFIPFLQPASNAKGLQAWQLFVDAFDGPESQILQKMRAAKQTFIALPDYCIIWKLISPSYEGAFVLCIKSVGAQRAMIAALACERYRLANGDWPESLDALVPTYIDAVPLDPFDAKPIRYEQIKQGIVVYSIGEDETDSAGDVRRLEPYDARKKATDEGYVLLDPDLRGREPAATSQPDESNDAAQ